MNEWREWRVTAVLTVVTLIASVLLILTDNIPAAAIEAGFIPGRIGGVPVDHVFLVPEWLTPLTATLIHGGWAHVALNLVMLVFCGQQVERALGPAALLILYGVGAYLAAAGQWAFDPASTMPMIGASGAISAIIAAYALLYGERRARRMGPLSANIVHAAWLAAAWIGIQLLIDLAGMGGVAVAIGAHIGGFVAGLVLTRPLLMWRYRSA
ncbi:rhomboid family intramembrane serine protease [Sphingomonas sp. Leaf343]|uniref:rhomboid family intramembrane serine protease n=1 Tax=Sphingomonas sp. Leaf343 TaxID=1736345 RepID=UPI0006FCA151|nr:rhomboid family intramembrane serine protease [Sphingomonas sp. Leaf343]KQR81397.1 protease [Sphingomonas sp. Leaf343]